MTEFLESNVNEEGLPIPRYADRVAGPFGTLLTRDLSADRFWLTGHRAKNAA
jgi:hypothetical protein